LHTKPSLYNEGEKTEIGETAVCNLSSVNLKEHLDENNELDFELLANTISIQMRMLDNVIDLNFYPTKEAEKSNLSHRPVGAGSMGWADVFHAYGISYSSEEAVKFSDELYEYISFHCLLNSSVLAAEKGGYRTYEGSKWSKDQLPIDTYKKLMDYIGEEPISFDQRSYVPESNWGHLRKHIKEHGMRNSNTMAIAPTATISYIQGCSPGTEPDFSVLFVYESKSGNLLIINEWFVKQCKSLGIWDQNFIESIKAVDGDVSRLNGELPEELKGCYSTAFDHDQFKLIDGAAAKQKWIDMGQSLNLFNNSNSLKYLNDLYIHARNRGLKSTYYLRNKSASQIEKSTTASARVEVSDEESSSCSILNGTDCESCQ
jgi:ribonucleoside-diphosphate reductase alpha chain